MSSSACFSLYYSKTDMDRWKAFAVATGIVRGNGEPIIGASVKQLASLGFDAHMTRDVAGTMRLGNEQILKLLAEVLGGSRELLHHLDKDGKLYAKSRVNAEKLYVEAMLPLTKRR